MGLEEYKIIFGALLGLSEFWGKDFGQHFIEMTSVGNSVNFVGSGMSFPIG